MSRLHSNIQAQAEKLGLSLEAVSRKAGLDKTYLRKLFERADASPRMETLQRIADALETSVLALTDDPSRPAEVRPSNISAPILTDMPRDVPVFGTAAGSHTRGAFQLFDGVVDYARRPPPLAAVRDLYALYVEGESMAPQYNPGDLVFINPNKPARLGDIVVIQSSLGPNEPIEATIGILRGRTADKITIGKHNPPADVHLTRSYVKTVHRVVTNNEVYGI